MRKFALITICFFLSLGLWAQTGEEGDPAAIGRRYQAESDQWRLSLVHFIMRGEEEKYQAVESEMKQFTAATTSYVVYKRPGHALAQELYYRNLENINRIEQLKQLVESSHRENPDYTKNFFNKYDLDDVSFSNFDNFEREYQRVMNRWRGEFEAAMQEKSSSQLKILREDMKILQQAVSAFVLLPGRSSNKVPQLQTMENELRHGIVMLRMYAETLGD